MTRVVEIQSWCIIESYRERNCAPPPIRDPMRTRPSSGRFDFRRSTVDLVLDGRNIQVPVIVSHDSVVADTTFLDFGPAYDCGPVVHRLDVFPDVDEGDHSQGLREHLTSIESPRHGTWVRGPRAPGSVPLLATLDVMEHPDSIRRQVGRPWFWPLTFSRFARCHCDGLGCHVT